MPWVFRTPLGVPVEPEVNRIFATTPGPAEAKAAWTSAPGGVARSPASGSAPARWPVLTIMPGAAGPPAASWGPVPGAAATSATASSAAAKRAASSANTAPGRISPAMARILAWSWLCSEYATLTGATGTPAVSAPSVTSR